MKSLLKFLSPNEKRLINALFLIALVVFLYLIIHNYFKTTEPVPVFGGEYKEGVIGALNSTNPVLSPIDDANQTIINLVFSGILKADGKGGVKPDLASDYDILENGKVWKIYLKKNILWQDGEKFTADDVIFTVSSILNPDSRSPLYLSWQGVKTEKIDDHTLIFTLKSPYAIFERNLANLKIIPKHIWEKTPPANFHLSEYNLKPIGTGPYQYENFERSKNGIVVSYKLKANDNYFEKKPYIKNFIINFYNNQNEALKDYDRAKISGVSNVFPKTLGEIKSKHRYFEIRLPRSYAVFLNLNLEIFSKKNVRLALDLAVDKNFLVKEIFHGKGEILSSPFSSGMPGFDENLLKTEFSPDKAKKLLIEEGYKDEDGDGFLDKLKFTLRFPESPFLMETAGLLKNQWEKAGIKIELQGVGIDYFKENYIKPRDFEAMLFGQVLNYDPDLFSFWHSSERFDPGLNIALYENKEVDRLIEESRQSMTPEVRLKKLSEIKKILTSNKPAIFLYNPYYLYLIHPAIKGINISALDLSYQRFFDVENWHIKTKRVKKLI